MNVPEIKNAMPLPLPVLLNGVEVIGKLTHGNKREAMVKLPSGQEIEFTWPEIHRAVNSGIRLTCIIFKLE